MERITGKTRVVGVWGCPVGHSRSPTMHNAALNALGLDWVYAPFEVKPEQVEQAVNGLRALNMVGVNVTVPLKEWVLPCLDVVDETASRIGSVNTIHNVGGKLHGYSTDGAGFLRSLREVGQSVEKRQVLLLGAGGSARAVAFALAEQGCHCRIANRTQKRAETLVADVNRWYPGSASVAGWGQEAGDFDLLVNATSLGMQPQEEAMPALPPTGVHPGVFVVDLIYAPPQTRLLAAAQAAGCASMNGLKMLVWQGAQALSLWSGIPLDSIPTAVMEEAVSRDL